MTITELFNQVKGSNGVTLVLRGRDLYERCYVTYTPPEYTLLKRNLSEEELKECAELGIYR